MKFGRLLISGGLICGVFAGAAELEPVATSVSRASVYLAMNQEDERELEDRLARAELTEASETTTAEQVLEQPDADLKSRIGVGFAFMVGTLAKMRATERFSGSVGPATGGRMNRDYLNGFVYLDSSDNLGDVILPNRTHHFGFDTPSQVTLESGAGSIDFNDVRMEGGSSLSPEQDPFSPGWELFYSRRIGEKGERWDREIEIGLNFLDFDYETRSGNAVFGLLTDRYALGGVDPTARGVPYAGGFLPAISGSPKIGDLPTRSFSTLPGSVTGRTEIQAQTLFLRLGPSFRYQSSERWAMHLHGGAAFGYYDAQVDYNELRSVSLGGMPMVSRLGGSFGDNDFVWGIYAGIRTTYRLTRKLEALGELRYTWTDSCELSDAFRTVELQMSDGVGFLMGVSYSF